MYTWNRHKERETLWKWFKRNKNIALFGPRRLGKTYLMHLLEQDAESKGYKAVFVDLQDVSSPSEATKKLVREVQKVLGVSSIWSHLKARVGNLIGGDPEAEDLTAAILKVDWEDGLHSLLAAADESEQPLVLLLDEVSVCLESSLAADQTSGSELLRLLRVLRSEYPRVRWLLTGSLGIDQIADRYGLGGALNDLESFRLETLSSSAAIDFVDHLCEQYELPSLTTENHLYLQDRLGWLAPFYLEGLVLRIEDVLEKSPHGVIDDDIIDQACREQLKHPFSRMFSDWPDHINRNYPEKTQAVAHRLLRVLCRNPAGETFDTLRSHPETGLLDEELCKETLTYLVNDGYIEKVAGTERYKFVFGLLREYWYKVYA